MKIPSSTGLSGKGYLCVLIVADSPPDAELFAQALRRAGYEPAWQWVETETAYLANLKPELDLVLSDFALPQFSGLKALALLKKRKLDVPLILVSTTIGVETAVAAMQEGAADYLMKDQLERLGQAVAPALEPVRLRRAVMQAELAQRESGDFVRDVLNSRSSHGRRNILTNTRDLTEARKLEDQFLRAQRIEAIGSLACGIAHDLNNILGPILVITPVLRAQCSGARELELLAMVEQGARRGANLTRRLLTFSRGSDGERGVVQPRYLLEEMVAIMRETFPHGIAINAEITDDLWTINADATQLHQVLLNLCVNARDAMPNGGSLTLNARNVSLSAENLVPHPSVQPGPFVRFAVIDTGEGIARENLERIFEPFFTTKEVGWGTGLGLSTVMRIVRSHHGFVAVLSKCGVGSTFEVYLPVASETTSATEVPLALGAGEGVLAVDDEGAISTSARKLPRAPTDTSDQAQCPQTD